MEKFLLEMVRPYIVPFVFGIGWATWKFRDKVFGFEKEKPDVPHRRKEDQLVSELIEKFEESNKFHKQIAEALCDNGKRLDELKEEIVHELRVFSRDMKETLGDVHRRIDKLYSEERK